REQGVSRMTQNTSPWTAQVDPLAQDIAAVLKRMGGSAHQKDVVQCVCAMKRQRGETVAQDLASKIVEVFEKSRALFFKPFGEQSMRWALQPGVARSRSARPTKRPATAMSRAFVVQASALEAADEAEAVGVDLA